MWYKSLYCHRAGIQVELILCVLTQPGDINTHPLDGCVCIQTQITDFLSSSVNMNLTILMKFINFLTSFSVLFIWAVSALAHEKSLVFN